SPPPISDGGVNVESLLLCVVDDTNDDPQQVVVEYIYNQTTGERTGTRYLDPTTNEPVEIPEGATISQCVESCHNTTSVLLCDETFECSESNVTALESPASYNNYDAGEEPEDYCLVD